MYAEWPNGDNLPIAGSTVVELGCGATTPLGFLMVVVALLGAKRVVGIDVDPIQNALLAGGGIIRRVLVGLSWPPSARAQEGQCPTVNNRGRFFGTPPSSLGVATSRYNAPASCRLNPR